VIPDRKQSGNGAEGYGRFGERKMARSVRILFLIVQFVILISSYGLPASASEAEAAIRAALEQWRLDFNDRRAEHICDLFSPELRYDFQGLPEQNFALLCNRLQKALSDQTKSIQYGLRVKEVIVSDALAIVRLTWISTVSTGEGVSTTDDEQGLDVFARQPGGGWKLIRYIAFPERPECSAASQN